MSALARYFKNIGKQVSGYDKRLQLWKELIESGIAFILKIVLIWS
jgi:UDP-N-acetylmuramate--alanine ligase